MKKNWGATGVTDFVHGKLEEHEQQQIRDELASRSIMLTSDEDFLNDLDLAINRFLTTRKLADESKPSAVRKNRKGAIDAALELHKRLDELDGNSAQLIEEMNSGGVSELRDRYIWKVISCLSDAYNLAQRYPTKGRLDEPERIYCAEDVARAILKHTNAKPTTTKGGLFEAILSIVMEAATGEEVQGPHELVRKALRNKHLIESDPGEYYLLEHKGD